MLKIEIFPEHEQPITRTLPGKDGKQARTIREQIGYAYLGGKFPVEMKLSLQDDQSAYKSGNYELDSSSFTVNNFGGLELKRFGIKLVRSMK
ncbi:G5P family DNA-binding protein [Vibrio sp. Isolate30]|uniref:G5P family DNA-binding protein n=1 Tax=Vibrio sp. Isolate30 TaxID=2908536 RepID=UPI001EFCFD9A|nr:G5P family DNA-binding protein [Vibrio sp. Isolate30]MCG9630139.1 G5P family DNA-binding protein [Vibrio sp. Isolate30]